MPVSPEVVELAMLLGGGIIASKAGLKFIETISPAFGRLYTPVETVIQAHADVKAAKIKALGDVNIENAVAKYKTEISQTLPERAADRNEFKQNRQQKNLEDTFKRVPEFLPDEVSDEKVDEDWFFQYVDYVEDISREEMQTLWAKILADEIAQPKSFSLRTLAILKNMSKDEAEIFAKVSKAAFSHAEMSFILSSVKDIDIMKAEFGITFSDILDLRELGLLLPSTLGLHPPKVSETENTLYIYGDTGIFLKREVDSANKVLDVEFYSKPGKELLSLLDKNEFHAEYIKRLVSRLPNSSVQYGKIQKEGDDYTLFYPKPFNL